MKKGNIICILLMCLMIICIPGLTVKADNGTRDENKYRQDKITSMDSSGNIYELEDGLGIIEDNTVALYSLEEDVQVVNFRTKGNALTNYKEVLTGNDGYVNGAYAADAAYLGTYDGKVKFMLSGVVGLVDESEVQVISVASVQSYSFYKVVNGQLIHRISQNLTVDTQCSELNNGPAPSYLDTEIEYYSYDGKYFYTDYGVMLQDYQNDSRENSVNPESPYYNYYQYLPLRSQVAYTREEMNTILDSKVSSTSAMKGLAGSFYTNQNTYGVNAILMISVAANESGWGTSNICLTKNNLFGLNAIDEATENADTFESVDECVRQFASHWMSQQYLNPNSWKYCGGFLGNKASGINVRYASDPYWGEKAANIAWTLDALGGCKDRLNYSIGVKDIIATNHSSVDIKSGPESSSTTIYKSGKHSNYAVLLLGTELNNNFYRIQSDAVLSEDRQAVEIGNGEYKYSKMYSYITAESVRVVNNGIVSGIQPDPVPEQVEQKLTDIKLAKESVDIGLNELVKLYYNVEKNGEGTITVYDEKGGKVKQIYDQIYHSSGYYLATWDGKNDVGAFVTAGRYKIVMEFDDCKEEIWVAITNEKAIKITEVRVDNENVTPGTTVKIYYNIDKDAVGNIAVYDEDGEIVQQIYDEVKHSAGYYLAFWNGKDASGKVVADGRYDIRIWFGNKEEIVSINVKSSSILKNVKIAENPVNIKNNEFVRLYYSVEKACTGDIEVHSASGDKVKTIYDNIAHTAMYYLATWDGKNDAGQKVKSGVYTIRLSFDNDVKEVIVEIKNDIPDSGLVLSDLKALPSEVHLAENDEVRFYYNVSKACYGTIGVYNSAGELVKEIYDNVSHAKGYYYAFWNLKDKNGKYVEPGNYTVKMEFELSGDIKTGTLPITVKDDLELSNVHLKADTVDIKKGDLVNIYYNLSKSISGDIYVCDQNGKIIRNIYDNVYHGAGYYLATWDGKDNDGQIVDENKYIICLKFGSKKAELMVNLETGKNSVLRNLRVDEESFNLAAGTEAKIYYGVEQDCVGSIAVYDKDGVKVKTIYDRVQHAADWYLATWNLKNDKGSTVPTGEYTIKFIFEKVGVFSVEKEIRVDVKNELALINVSIPTETVKLTNGEIKVYYNVTHPCEGNIQIYNEVGEKVYTLYEDVKHTAGYYSAFWTFKDESGKTIEPGKYMFKLEFSDATATKTAEVEFNVIER